MTYIPQVWEDLPSSTTPLSGERLMYMEEGINAAHQDLPLVPGSEALPTNDLSAFGIELPEKYGAIGDDVADDAAAVQACFTATVAGGKRGYFNPAKTYKLKSVITVPQGSHWSVDLTSAKLKQYADNTPILKFTKENTWDWEIKGGIFSWATLQDATKTQAIAVDFHTDTNFNNGIYHWKITKPTFERGFCGIGQGTAGGVINPAWSGRISGVMSMGSMSGYVIDLNRGPNIHIDDFYALRNNSTLPGIRLQNLHVATLKNVEFNTISRRVVEATSVEVLLVDGIRVEGGTFTGSFDSLFVVSGGTANFRGVEVQSINWATGNWGSIFTASAGASMTVDHVNVYDNVMTNNACLVFCSGAADFEYRRYKVRAGAALTAIIYPYDASESKVRNGAQPVAAANSTAAITLQGLVADGAPIHRVTLTANTTITLPATVVGKSILVHLAQDATGGRTVAWAAPAAGSIKWPGGVAPMITATATKEDVIEFICTVANVWVGIVKGQNY